MKTPFKNIHDAVIDTLRNKLPKYLTYHSVDHTIYVLNRAIYIAQKMEIKEADLKLLKIAALYHDIGFIETNIEHEAIGCKIARKELKAYGYSQSDIETICGMIMATKIPQQPQTQLERILADADLEYLGTKHFEYVSNLLYQEMTHYNPKLILKEWNKIQIRFIENHQYHTPFCKRYKTHRKLKALQKLKSTV